MSATTINWRGHITDVVTREQTQVQTLDAIVAVLEAELKALAQQNQ